MLLSLAPAATALERPTVDVELVLAVDVSLSMSQEELVIQRDGYVAALTHPTVIEAIREGLNGRIAVAYVEWAGAETQHVAVPWTIIGSAADAEDFARRITDAPPRSARRTSISAAIDFSRTYFSESGVRGFKRVIDVSGDGPNNQGEPVFAARDRAVNEGIIVNGLPLMTESGSWTKAFDIHNLDGYYEKCVIGGPGAFMVPVNDWPQFPEAIRRKLVLELAGMESPAWLREHGGRLPVVPVVSTRAVDCLIGEKTWGEPFPADGH